MRFGFLGKSTNTHNPINRQALAVGTSMASWVANFDKRHPICPISSWLSVFKVFYKNNQYQVHGIKFDNNNNAYIECTINNLLLKGQIDSNGNIYNVQLLTDSTAQQLMRGNIGLTFDPTFTYLFSTNFLATVPDKPSVPKIVYTNCVTGETTGLVTPVADSLIIGPNGPLLTYPNPTSKPQEYVIYVCSWGTGQIIQVTIDATNYPPTEVSASVFANLPIVYAQGGVAALFSSIAGKAVNDIPSLQADGKLIQETIMYLWETYQNTIPSGPVSVVPYPGGDPLNPSSLLVACRLTSQVVEVQITPTPGLVRVISTSANGLNFVPFAYPNSFSLSNFTYILASNSYTSVYGPNYGPTVTKLGVNGEQLPFIPTCVLNYFTTGVRCVITQNDYIYMVSTGNSTIYKISINEINKLV